MTENWSKMNKSLPKKARIDQKLSKIGEIWQKTTKIYQKSKKKLKIVFKKSKIVNSKNAENGVMIFQLVTVQLDNFQKKNKCNSSFISPQLQKVFFHEN